VLFLKHDLLTWSILWLCLYQRLSRTKCDSHRSISDNVMCGTATFIRTMKLKENKKIKNRKTLYVFLCRSVWLFLYGPFCHGALKLDISTLFTTFFIWTSSIYIIEARYIQVVFCLIFKQVLSVQITFPQFNVYFNKGHGSNKIHIIYRWRF